VLKGFRDFIMRGNIVDLAVGVVIGVAFTSLVDAFTNAFLYPLIKLLSGGKEVGGSFTIRGVEFDYALFINGLIAFMLAAAVLYFFVVVPMNKLNERRARGQTDEPETQPSEEAVLLAEIRDALVANGAGPRTEVTRTRADES
jgi:large conductance mechanosensitive channel